MIEQDVCFNHLIVYARSANFRAQLLTPLDSALAHLNLGSRVE